MNELMIDLETLGQAENTIVISIGACFFNLEKGSIGPTFYMALDIDEQLKKGRSITADTLKWWMGQSEAAKTVFNEKAKSPQEVLNTFVTWVLAQNSMSKIKPWGNGATFDIAIMENLLKTNNIKIPWLYYNVQDFRTFRRFIANNEKVEKLGIAHNAKDDAVAQANFVIKHFNLYKQISNKEESINEPS